MLFSFMVARPPSAVVPDWASCHTCPPMQTLVEDRRLPLDIDAQPVVQAAAALKPALRHYQDEIEREQRLSPELVEQMHAAGFYQLTLPRSLGGLQADPLTYIRVVELLAEGVGSVGWNV